MKKLFILFFVSIFVLSSCSESESPTFRTYSTSFLLTENPISENGNWVNGEDVGLDWCNVVTTSGLAIGTNKYTPYYCDPTALLTGIWGADQTVEATVYSVNQKEDYWQEVELRLRSNISPHSITGYEIFFRCLKSPNGYWSVVRWNGALGDFTGLAGMTGSQYGVTNGDVVKASIIGNEIKVYINDVLVGIVIDSTFSTGNPGIGFNYGQGSTYSDFGFTRFTASEVPPQSADLKSFR